jgi:hypothetical protein
MSMGAPRIVVPSSPEFWRAFQIAVVPQLALTLTNAVIVTAALSRELFPTAKSASERNLALSSGLANVLLAPFGAMPMCPLASRGATRSVSGRADAGNRVGPIRGSYSVPGLRS